MDNDKRIDIGHVVNLSYTGHGYEREALSVLIDHAFDELGAAAVTASWASDDSVKLEPLKALGMRVVEMGTGRKFAPEPDGSYGEFACCRLELTDVEWRAR